MAAPTLTVQTIVTAGTTITYSAATAAGDTFSNPDGRSFVHVKNGAASAVTVTVKSQQLCSQGFSHDITYSVPASGEAVIGPLTATRFTDANGNVTVQYSASTSVTIAALRI